MAAKPHHRACTYVRPPAVAEGGSNVAAARTLTGTSVYRFLRFPFSTHVDFMILAFVMPTKFLGCKSYPHHRYNTHGRYTLHPPLRI